MKNIYFVKIPKGKFIRPDILYNQKCRALLRWSREEERLRIANIKKFMKQLGAW